MQGNDPQLLKRPGSLRRNKKKADAQAWQTAVGNSNCTRPAATRLATPSAQGCTWQGRASAHTCRLHHCAIAKLGAGHSLFLISLDMGRGSGPF